MTRLALNHSTKNSVILAEEIELLTHYIELERIRFSNSFDYEIETNEISHLTKIPPMLIQPFVENAILHGLAPKKEKGFLKIEYLERDSDSFYCIITDNGIGRKEVKSKFKKRSLGIKLVKDRLGIIARNSKEERIQIIDLTKNNQPAGTKVILILPLNL